MAQGSLPGRRAGSIFPGMVNTPAVAAPIPPPVSPGRSPFGLGALNAGPASPAAPSTSPEPSPRPLRHLPHARTDPTGGHSCSSTDVVLTPTARAHKALPERVTHEASQIAYDHAVFRPELEAQGGHPAPHPPGIRDDSVPDSAGGARSDQRHGHGHSHASPELPFHPCLAIDSAGLSAGGDDGPTCNAAAQGNTTCVHQTASPLLLLRMGLTDR